MKLSLLILYMMLFDFTLCVCMHFFNIAINRFFVPISVALAVLFLALNEDKREWKEYVRVVVFFSVIVAVIVLFISHVYSRDWDGNAYHKMAVGILKNGWNPLQESSADFAGRYFGDKNVADVSIWVDCYGKVSWYIAASIYAFVGNIEAGKAYNLLSLIALLFLEFGYLGRKFPQSRKRNLIFSLITVSNPVFVSQILQYYVDGFMGIMLFILIIGLSMMIDDTFSDKEAWMVIVPSMAILGNIKFTGLAYGGIFCVIFYIYSVVRCWNPRKIKIYIFTMFRFVFLAIFTICGVGYTTYVTNMIHHSNPLYPLLGVGKVDIMTNNSPAGFEGKGSLYKLFYGLFGACENLTYDLQHPLPKLKVPFTFQTKEIINCMQSGELRISGYGIFFSGIFLVALGTLTVWVIYTKRNKVCKKESNYVLVLSGTIVGLSLAVSDSWWARYSPYIYILPLLAVAVLMYKTSDKRYRMGAGCLVLVFFLNNLFFFGGPVYTVYRSIEVRNQFEQLQGEKIQIVNNEYFPGLYFNLEDQEIDYEIIFDPSVEGEHMMYHGLLEYNIK